MSEEIYTCRYCKLPVDQATGIDDIHGELLHPGECAAKQQENDDEEAWDRANAWGFAGSAR